MKTAIGSVVGVGILVAMFAPIWPIGGGATICSSPEVLETLKAGFYKDFARGGAVEVINTGPIGINGNISLCSGETHRLESVTGAELILHDGAPFEYAIQPLDSGKFRVTWSPKVLLLGQVVTYSYVGPMSFEQVKREWQFSEEGKKWEADRKAVAAKKQAEEERAEENRKWNESQAAQVKEARKTEWVPTDAELEEINRKQAEEQARIKKEAEERAKALAAARQAEEERKRQEVERQKQAEEAKRQAAAAQRQATLDDHRRRHVAWCQSMFNGQIDPRLANGLGTSGKSRREECIALRANGQWDGPDTN